MPLQKISLDSILGLNTERNDSSGINSPNWSSMSAWAVENASSGATNPNTLLNCTNIIISRNKQATTRIAFREVWDFTTESIAYGAQADFFTVGLYSIPNSTVNAVVFPWITNENADIANFVDALEYEMQSTRYIIGGVTSSDFTLYLNLKPDFGWNTGDETPFPVKSFNIARFNTSYSNIYVFSSNGVFRTTTSYINNPGPTTNYNLFKKITLPLVKTISATLTTSPDDANRWFPSGSQVNIKVLLTDQITATQLYQGKPSRPLTVTNTASNTSILISFSVDNTNIALNSGGVAVFRTVSFAPEDNEPTEYYKCWESSLSAGTTVSSTTTFTNIELTLNDTSLVQFLPLYTNATAGESNTTGASAESAAPPTARDVVIYNNYAVYGNVMVPPFAVLTMTALPNIDGNDKLQVGATTISLEYTPNSTTPPSNNGVIDGVTGTFSGVSKTPNTDNGYNLIIRPQDPNINSTGSSDGTYSVPWYAIADKLTLATGTGATQDIQITPKPGELFDITKFAATGIIAVVGSKTTGNVVALFTYQSFEQTTASGYYTFQNCLAYGVPFTDQTWTTTLAASGTYVLYYIPATSPTAMDVYAIGSDATGYGSEVGFSLLPTYDRFPDRTFNNRPVGTVASLNQNGSSVSPAFSPVLAAISFTGVYALDAGELLDQATKNLCDSYNSSRNKEDPYAVYVESITASVGQVRFESIYSGYNHFSTYTNDPAYTSGTGFYDQITARVFRDDMSAPTVQFAEPIPVNETAANIMQQSVQTISGIILSKFNKPEEIPIGQNLAPTVVGDPLRPIIKLINQSNQLLIFKENEGTFRLDTTQANILPTISILSLLDNTAWLLLPESVQVFENTVIYFSNKGFVAISSAGNVSEISPTIATELLQNYSTIFNNGHQDKVRSWVITQQRLYCCYFPYVNQDNTSSTYIFNFSTGQWTKWTGEINDVVVSATGQLTLVENIFNLEEIVNTQQELNLAPLNFNSKYWSVIRQADFQLVNSTQIEDVIDLSQFTITSLNNSTIEISDFNNDTVYGNLYYILSIWKDRTFWVFSEENGYYRTKLTQTTPASSITLQFIDSAGNGIVHPPIVGNEQLQVTVNAALYFNKFFISLPRGSTLTHFNEVQIYTQDGEQYRDIFVGFNSTNNIGNYIVLNDGSTIVTTNSGEYLTLNNSISNVFAPYYPLSTSIYSFRVLVPLIAARGRFIQIAIRHDTPNEVLKINSIVYIYRDLQSTKIKNHSQ